MRYVCWSFSGFRHELLPIEHLLGKEAEEWTTKCPFNPHQKLPSYEDAEKWLRDKTNNFQYGDYVNWPRILSDLALGRSRAFAVFQPSGRIWVFAIFIYDNTAVSSFPTSVGTSAYAIVPEVEAS